METKVNTTEPTEDPRVEPATWNPSRTSKKVRRASTWKLMEMQVGDVWRIYHPDLQCGGTGKACGLALAATRLRKKGYKFTMYHEGAGIAVVKRLA